MLQRVKFTKNKLISYLQEKGVVTKGKLADLISAAQNGIPIEEEIQKYQDGWAGKTKGLLQVSF
jgi:hypothetical protein